MMRLVIGNQRGVNSRKGLRLGVFTYSLKTFSLPLCNLPQFLQLSLANQSFPTSWSPLSEFGTGFRNAAGDWTEVEG